MSVSNAASELLDRLSGAEENIRNAFIVRRRRVYWRRYFSHLIGKRMLTGPQSAEIREYWSRFHKKVDPVFHEFYLQKTGKFFANYIPDDLYYCEIDPYFNNWHAAVYMDNKCYYRLLLSDVRQPEILALRVNGIWFLEQDGEIAGATEDDVVSVIRENDSFLKQATHSLGGKGIRFISKNSPPAEIKAKIAELYDDIVVQKRLTQSGTMSRLNPSSVNTVRVLSLLNTDGSVRICSAVARMGVNGSIVDNASKGGITCGVNPDGRLKNTAYTAKGEVFRKHPDTGIEFDEIVVPNYAEVLETVRKAHPRFSHFRLLSWDFAIGEDDRPVLIEVNLCYGELDFHQLNNGPLFGDDTEKILQEVFDRKA